jgi:hypothetical protein
LIVTLRARTLGPAVGAEQDYLLFSGGLGRCDLRVNEYTAYCRRQDFANAAIAASRVGS